MAHSIGHRAQNAERRHADDQAHRPEQDLGNRVDQSATGSRRVADQREADAEDDREKQHLQHVVARQRVERGGRNDVQDEAADAAALQLVGIVRIGAQRVGVEAGGVDVHAVAGREHDRPGSGPTTSATVVMTSK